jgi:5-(carboxyamino)imidazole ribonucleotide synthase
MLAGTRELLREPDLKLHLYGKRHASLRRKMGHFTVLGTDLASALAKAERGRGLVTWRPSRSPQPVG